MKPHPTRGGKEASASGTGSSTVRGRIDSFSCETVAPLYILLFPDLCDPSLGLMTFVRNSDGTVSWHKTLPFAVLIEFQRILWCFQIKHKQSVMMFVQVKVGLVLRVRGSDPMTTLGRKNLLFCLGYIPTRSGNKSSRFY